MDKPRADECSIYFDLQKDVLIACAPNHTSSQMVKGQVVVESREGVRGGNRITGGHPVANQGVARMDKQNKQVAALLKVLSRVTGNVSNVQLSYNEKALQIICYDSLHPLNLEKLITRH